MPGLLNGTTDRQGDAPIVAAASLDARGQNRDHGADDLTLPWIPLHMIEEVARHVGHLDIIREQLDSTKGYF
jgi:Protein of unknown function (DUF664)